MNTCLKHQQQYPQDGFCVYCGKPETKQQDMVPLPLPYQPLTPPSWPLYTGYRCWGCGAWVSYYGAHLCNVPAVRCVVTSNTANPTPQDTNVWHTTLSLDAGNAAEFGEKGR